jgi:glutamyl-tRNA reductase
MITPHPGPARSPFSRSVRANDRDRGSRPRRPRLTRARILDPAILALGVSHRHATVELLDRLAFTEDDLAKAYRRVADDPAIEEAVIVSTCNRVEIYGTVPSYHAGFQALKRILVETRDVSTEDLAEPLYAHYELEAAEHAFAVASGLDSMVLGEPQILSQVRDALRPCRGCRSSPQAPFHAAARTSRGWDRRRRRGLTLRGRRHLGAEALGGLEGSHAVVVGAGQMAALAVKHLRDRGVATVRVLNRSLERARALAERTEVEHGDLEALPHAIADADLLVSATGAAGIVVPQVALAGRERPLFVLDLAVPRDVDPSARDLPSRSSLSTTCAFAVAPPRPLGTERAERTTPRSTASRSGGGPAPAPSSTRSGVAGTRSSPPSSSEPIRRRVLVPDEGGGRAPARGIVAAPATDRLAEGVTAPLAGCYARTLFGLRAPGAVTPVGTRRSPELRRRPSRRGPRRARGGVRARADGDLR